VRESEMEGEREGGRERGRERESERERYGCIDIYVYLRVVVMADERVVLSGI